MFVDQVDIEVKAGDGGNGAVTFRREKYVPRGGPSGGHGGRGGSLVFELDTHLSTLLDFRYKSKYLAPRGGDGASKDMFGKDGHDMVLKVPPGTMVYNRLSGVLIADITETTPRAVVAKGGTGGRGNAHFATSVHQAPRFAENGEPGQEFSLRLELKLLADVGLLGFPSVGKSTLIAAVSAARPKIAEYPFTTLIPNLGVVAVDEGKSFVMADLPGLIEGAHKGAGLGHQFLRHVERTRVLVHILDVSGMTGREPLHDFAIINHELELHDARLSAIPQIVALNKIDVCPEAGHLLELETILQNQGLEVFCISAATRAGLKPLIYRIWERLEEARESDSDAPAQDRVVIRAEQREDARHWEVEAGGDGLWTVAGAGFERMVAMTDMNNDHAVRRLQKSLERAGVYRKLKQLGAKEGDVVRIRNIDFDYIDEDDDSDVGRHRTRTPLASPEPAAPVSAE